ncbi:MAG: protein kinase [Candidatus Aminicenantes bacterium]|nr:protein kinase [Candidatus Aminicenantes bacterium]
MTIQCPKCQHENPDTLKFCGECGTQLYSPQEGEFTETLETPRQELTTGVTFANRYQIIEELGKGGMGRVYKALDRETQEKIALKLIKPEIASDQKTVARFRNELTSARKISHPHVCRMYDLGKEKGSYFITMEYVPGEDLRSFIRRAAPLSTARTISIAKQVCEGLMEAHKLGVIHRDLKPQNIMIDKQGNARIMDFGIARSLKAKSITGAGMMIGTPEYMSPEQVEGKEVEPRSDIYSLGVILYEMVTGKVPFEGETPFAIGVKHKSEPPKPPKELNDQIPDDLNQVILNCLEKNKEKRYQNAKEMWSELEGIEKGIPTAQKIAAKPKPLTSRQITVTFGFKKLWIPAAALAGMVLIVIALWQLLPSKKTSSFVSENPSLAVMYFENRTQTQDLDKILVDMLTTNLSRIDGIEVVSSQRLFDILRQLGKQDIESIDKTTATQVATQAGVKAILTGSIIQVGDRVRITSNLADVQTGAIIGSEQVEGSQINEDIFAMVDGLTEKIGETLGILSDEADKELKIADVTTDSLEAYKHYQKGMDHIMRWRLGEAADEFRKAIDFDPTFAMAYVRLASAEAVYGNRTVNPFFDLSSVKETMETANKYSHKTTEREQMMIDIQTALFIKHDFELATSLAKKMIEKYPKDKDGYFYFITKYFYDQNAEDLKKYSNIILEIDPTEANAYNMLAYAHAMQNNPSGVHSALKKYIALQSNEVNPYDSAWETLMMVGRYDEAVAYLEQGLKKNPDWNYFHREIGITFLLEGDADRAREKYKIYAKYSPSAENLAARFLGYSYLFEGRYNLAENEFRNAVSLAQEQDDVPREMLARLDVGRILVLQDKHTEAFSEYDAAVKASKEIYSQNFNPVPLITDYLKGMALAKRRDYEGVQSHIKAIRKKIQEFNDDVLFLDFYHLLMGELYFVQRKDEPLQSSLENMSIIPRFNSAHYRKLLIASYELKGDLEKTVQEYLKFYNNVILAAYGMPEYFYFFREASLVNYNVAQLYEKMGNGEKAIEHYEKFIDLWKNADNGIAEIRDAHKRLSGLKKVL